jgi:uncharacterized Zn finger protein
MFCFHKYGKIEDGYQYCKKCGKAHSVKCSHKWEEYSKIYNGSKGAGYLLKCKRCGEFKKYTIYD